MLIMPKGVMNVFNRVLRGIVTKIIHQLFDSENLLLVGTQVGRWVSVSLLAPVPLGYPVFPAQAIVFLGGRHMGHRHGDILGWDQVNPCVQIEGPFRSRCGPGLADLFLEY